MNTCKNCIFWEDISNSGDPRFKNCRCPKFAEGYGTACSSLSSDSVLVEDDEGWAMFTGSDFGCVHFSAKEKS